MGMDVDMSPPGGGEGAARAPAARAAPLPVGGMGRHFGGKMLRCVRAAVCCVLCALPQGAARRQGGRSEGTNDELGGVGVRVRRMRCSGALRCMG